jgi:hypothetical protein
MSSVLVFLLVNSIAFGQVSVTSQEEFKRLGEGDSPYNLKYNFERAYLEVAPSTNCPSDSKAFLFVHINKEGYVKSVRGHSVALSADLRSVSLKWANGLLKQLHFKPLVYGNQPSSVDMALTLVCDAS